MGGIPELLGRSHVVAVLDEALESAEVSGAGNLVLVSGEAGIGKSAVLAWLVDRATPTCRVLRGFCSEHAGAPPYWPWSQVLRASHASAAELGEAARLLDPAGSTVPDGVAEAADAQFRLLDAVSRFLVRASSDRPVVVVIDDLHWADPGSLALLAFVARAVRDAPVLLVGAFRDTEAPDEMSDVSSVATQVVLVGLERAEVAAMVAAIPGPVPAPAVVEQVWRRSGGNPFFVGELTRLVQAHGSATPPKHLPASIIETVRRRLARLSSTCVRLLDWCAVGGKEIDVGLLVAAGATDDADVAADELAHAERAGIITMDPPAFVHDLYREAVLEDMGTPLRREIHHALGRVLAGIGDPDSAARAAAHLLAAGTAASDEAVVASLQAAEVATSRLGHTAAIGHYRDALALMAPGRDRNVVLVSLAVAQDRAGRLEDARDSYRRVVSAGRACGDATLLARGALGLQALGHRSGEQDTEAIALLAEAVDMLERCGGPVGLRSRVQAASARVMIHGSSTVPGAPEPVRMAREAVALAEGGDDADALADAYLALHDALWMPGSAAQRKPVVDAMIEAADRAGDRDLVAQGHLLRATALLEIGDSSGRDELLEYVDLAARLGHARGRWGSLTRKATYAQLSGRAAEAAALGEEAYELGQAIAEPDAMGCFCTQRWSLVALGVREPAATLDTADPLWPLFPLMRAWPLVVRGDLERARELLGDFSVLAITPGYDLEKLAVAAVVFAGVGTTAQRQWAYRMLKPHAGLHVIIGGCAAYHAAVDHHLGALAASMGDRDCARAHFTDALRMHTELGAAGWVELTRHELQGLDKALPANEFRLIDDRWSLSFADRRATLPDAKGLADLHTIIAAHGRPVHVVDLLGPEVAAQVGWTGADRVLDDRAKAEYKARIDELAAGITEAEDIGDSHGAQRLDDERSAIIAELAAAGGFGGRDRRLGDATERARKTVGARIRVSLGKIERVHPELAAHMRASVHLGTSCTYQPTTPHEWRCGSPAPERRTIKANTDAVPQRGRGDR
ncbi:ATP-binding protein [Gordonia sp. NPDC003424]